MHVAFHPPEDITQQFLQLNKLIRVTAYLRRFINNCRHSKANRQTAILTTQDLDQALTCCEDGTTDFVCTRNQRLDRTARGCNYQFSQNTASIHQSGRSSKSRRMTTAVNTSLSSKASDDFACKSALHKTGCLSRPHQTSSCWATTPNSLIM